MCHALEKAVQIVGGQSKLARSLTESVGKTINQSDVWYWLNKSSRGVPAEYCQAFEDITEGKIKREDLRPDIFGATQ